MIRARSTALTLMFSLTTLLSSAVTANAQEKHAHDEAKGHAAAKYDAEVHDPLTNSATSKEFDLSKSEQKAELEKALAEGHVHELRLKKDPDIISLFSLATDLGVWSLVVFGLLLFVLGRIAWPKMLEGLRKREERIRGALDEAQKAKDEAQATQISLQKQLAQASEQVRQIIDEGRRDAQALRESEMAKTKADIQAERERLHREIESETDQALQRIWAQAADLATLVSAKALRRGIDESGQRRLIDEAVAEMRLAATRGTNGHA